MRVRDVRARDAVTAAAHQLQEAGIPSPRHDAEALLGHVLEVPRTRLAAAGALTDEQLSRFQGLVRRRADREPLQHILGSAPFRYVELEVGPGVFVPRPETELLAGWAIDVLRELEPATHPTAVDLGTGSGAIALALATEVPSASVHAVELSEAAFTYAQRNLSGSGVDLRHGDMAAAFPELDGTADVVVANPPYIPLTAYDSVEAEVSGHDPDAALWSGQDGLDAIRVVERTAARLLRPDGHVGCEHADVQGESAVAVFAGAGRWRDIRDHPDLAGRARFVTARRV